MTTPATRKITRKQIEKLLSLLSGSTCEGMQNLLENGHLIKTILSYPRPIRIDRFAFAAFLAMQTTESTRPLSSIPWMPVGVYVDHIMARSKLRGWGFTQADASKLNANLHDHDGPLTPTGVSIWLGRDLKFNWTEMTAWIEDEVNKLGFTFQDYFGPVRMHQLSFLPGSEVTGKRKLDVVDLDLATFLGSTNGVIPMNVRSSRLKWPGLEVATLLALNPQVYVAMDGETIPYLFASGLVVDSDGLPVFHCNSDGAYVHGSWDGRRWHTASMVAFRE
jgi:hypothetical protein